MHTALIIVHALTCLFAYTFLPIDGQSTCCPTANCCDNSCTPPTAFNISLQEFVSKQPLYVAFYPNIPALAGVDSTCYTFIPLPDGTYLLDSVRIYSNGLNVTESFTIAQSDVGVFPAGSATCNQQYTIFDYVNTSSDCMVYLAYLCFSYGDCSLSEGNNIPVMGLTPYSKAITQTCLNQTIDLINRDGVTAQNYTIVPMKNKPSCITNINCSVSTTTTTTTSPGQTGKPSTGSHSTPTGY